MPAIRTTPAEPPARDLFALDEARRILERPSLLVHLADVLGQPMEWIVARFGWSVPRAGRVLRTVVRRALWKAARIAVVSLGSDARGTGRLRHRRAVTLTGAVGGALGLPGLLAELPVTTVLMLRAIADIARQEGENLESPEARLACLEVFAFGGRPSNDDAAQSSYLAARIGLTGVLERVTEGTVARAAVRLIARIAPRYELAVAEKLVAQAVPLLGGLSGAVINRLFVEHFQRLARAHFTVRRLERTYGADAVRTWYAQLGDSQTQNPGI